MERLLNRRVVLAQCPQGPIQRQHFDLVTAEIDEVPDGHVVLRVILAQIAPAARAVMTTTTTGFDQTKVGDGILCAVVGEVVATSPGGPAPGSIVTSYALWEEYAVIPAAQTLPVLPGHPLVHNLGALGLDGLTAYFGMTRIGHPRTAETVVISAASGGVGHLAGQIAHHAGARVVGITGSDCKNQRLRAGYRFAQTVNHRSPAFLDDLRAACGESGADVYFDNVGGPVLDAMPPLMARRGRIVCCGAAAQYDMKDNDLIQPGPQGIPQYLINGSLRLEGFVVADFRPDWAQAISQLSEWLADGSIMTAIQMWEGLESAPEALWAVLAGESFGQAVVRIAPDPS